MHRTARLLSAILVATCAAWESSARAQPLGVELHNTMMPAAGAMGGASIARPQELLSALNGNPATLTNFDGSQFQFAGGWAYANFDLTQTGNVVVPGITPFTANSGAPGAAIGNIGLNRRTNLLGFDANFAFGLISNAGAAVDFRSVPESNGTSSNLLILELMSGFGVQLTDRLSVGTNLALGTAFFDGPFVGNSAMVSAYGLRNTVGVQYELTDATSAGFYWQSKQNYHFEDAVSLQLFNGTFTPTFDVRMDLPSNLGWGIANRRLLDGNLLLAFDVVYKQWSNADLFRAVYRDQWALQFGSQYRINRLRLRAGYVYARSPLKDVTDVTIGGIAPPGGIPAVSYLQATLAAPNQNRISAGIGLVDVLPGFDLDLFAGGMFSESAATGPFTSVRVDSYYLGGGATYRFGRNGVRASN